MKIKLIKDQEKSGVQSRYVVEGIPDCHVIYCDGEYAVRHHGGVTILRGTGTLSKVIERMDYYFEYLPDPA